MRKIKFRAWSKQHKEMLDVREIGFKQNGGIEFVILIKPRQINERGDIGFEFPKKYIDGNSLKLMQYTGLKDKNGKEVYEGDIVYFGFTGLVYYDKKKAQYRVDIEEGRSAELTLVQNGECYVKVIGNKYENPELLEEGTQ
jgi:uncharacterized phage protein (TIGR01671 family)